jgi:hypothetical protein
MVQAQRIFRGELVLVDGILWCIFNQLSMGETWNLHTIFNVRRLLESRNLDKRKAIFRQVFVRDTDACLKALFCVRKFLPLQFVRSLQTRPSQRQLTRLTTNLNGTPCVRESSFEKWNTPMTLSESSASSSSRGISCKP